MTAATLARPTGRCAPLDGLRPCEVRDPEWWTTGNSGNAVAIMLCRTACRFAGECPANNPRPIGVVVAGVPYDDRSRPLTVCAKCGHPRAQRKQGANAICLCPTAAHHHRKIMSMRKRGVPYTKIAAAVGLHVKTVRAYCHEVEARRNAERLARAGLSTAPSEHQELIVDLRRQGRTWLQVAEAIGCTPWTLKGYVKRQRAQGLIAA